MIAPDGAQGVFAMDALSAQNVRLYKRGLDGPWYLVAGSLGPCVTDSDPCQAVPQWNLTIEEVRQGMTLGIEARKFRISDDPDTWTGMVDLSYSVINIDGAAITADDYFWIDSNYGKTLTGPEYHRGDFNYDGVIDGDDYLLIDASFSGQGGFSPAPPAGVIAVPEPTSALSLAAMMLAGGKLRRRRLCRRCATEAASALRGTRSCRQG